MERGLIRKDIERIALISNVHGNLPALKAVLTNIEQRGIARVMCLGDLAGKGPDGSVIRGNWDEGLAERIPVLQWYWEELGNERSSWLGRLPFRADFTLGTMQVRLVHASPQGVFHRVHQTASPEELETMFANTDETGNLAVPHLVAYGDIHAAYVRCFSQRTLVNVGSVGNPLGLTLACYAIIEAPTCPLGPVKVIWSGCLTTLSEPYMTLKWSACPTLKNRPGNCARPAIATHQREQNDYRARHLP